MQWPCELLLDSTVKNFFIQGYSKVSLANLVVVKVLSEVRALPHTCMGNWFCEMWHCVLQNC